MNKIIVIVGPTGVGKTYVSVKLAHLFDAEIINADSVQIYKEFNIGSAKATLDEQEGIPHHLLDIKDINEPYTVYDYQKDGRNLIDKLTKENKNIIITGGTGLYIKSLLYDYNFNEEKQNNNDYNEYTNEELKEKVDLIFPENKIHINNRRRLVRFLNSYNETGKIIKNENKDKPLYEFTVVGLTMDRAILYKRLDKRVDDMINNGLISEAKSLYDKKALIFNSIIGYKEFTNYFEGNISLEETIDKIKQHTRNYAKRQYTWFNNQMNTTWFNIDINNPMNTVNEIYKFLSK